jgi:AbrB family looped-hinge helix DNA binding protein
MPDEIRLRVSQNGRIVIPASFREALGIAVQVVLRLQDDELRHAAAPHRVRPPLSEARNFPGGRT